MRSSFRLVAVCFVVGCAAKNGPRLETVKAEDEVEGMIKRRLNELRPCQAFTSFDRHFTKLVRRETLDDLVKVTVTPDFDDEDRPHVTTGGPLADASCVARRVKAWPWPKDALPATFTYRFRATEAQLAALKAQHQAAFDAFCHELGSISESDLDGLLTAVVNANEKMETSEDDVAQKLVWGTTIALHARKDERARMVAGTVREIAEEFDLKGCRTVRGWSTLDIEEVLDSPGMPADGCAARVRQLRALADPPSRGLAPRASSPRAEPLPADGFLLDLASMNADERRDAARLKALASAEAKKQGVTRPVAYVVPSYLYPKEVVGFAARWGEAFELRLVVAHQRPVPAVVTKQAWPAAVELLRRRHEKAQWLFHDSDIWSGAPDEHSYCPSLPEVPAISSVRDGVIDMGALVTSIAKELEACGCPNAYGEFVWARAALVVDELRGRAGWIALNVTTDPKAPRVKVDPKGELSDLVKVLGEAPVAIDFVTPE